MEDSGSRKADAGCHPFEVAREVAQRENER